MLHSGWRDYLRDTVGRRRADVASVASWAAVATMIITVVGIESGKLEEEDAYEQNT